MRFIEFFGSRIVHLYEHKMTPERLAIHSKAGSSYKRAINSGSRIPEFEHDIAQDPHYAYHYAYSFLQDQWWQGETSIITDPWYAYMYAKMVLVCRWPEAEPTIMTDPYWSFSYAQDIIGGRWPEAEPVMARHFLVAYKYSQFIEERFIIAENTIQKSEAKEKYLDAFPEARGDWAAWGWTDWIH